MIILSPVLGRTWVLDITCDPGIVTVSEASVLSVRSCFPLLFKEYPGSYADLAQVLPFL